MADSDWRTHIDSIVAQLKAAGWRDRDAIKDALLAYAQEVKPTAGPALETYLDAARAGLTLELRWEIDEVLEKLQPPPEPEPEPEADDAPEEDAADQGLSMADLVQVYHDPRGLALFTSKDGSRWFASQVDQMTGQPQTFELPPGQVAQLKQQLAGSPYWLLGSGGVAP